MTRPSNMSGYDDDFFAWTQEQAAALRHLSPGMVGEDVDVGNLAVEIEDLGKRDLREVKSFLKRVVEHLLKIDACPGSADIPYWRSETLVFQSSAVDAFSPGMRQLLNVTRVWQQGTKLAARLLVEEGVVLTIPTACPFTLDALLADDFDLDAALAAVAAARADRA